MAMIERLIRLYGEQAGEVLPRLEALIERWREPVAASFAERGDAGLRPEPSERTAVVIAYPDHLQRPGEPPLATLADWCGRHLRGLVSTVHVLPFHPSTSYEGYAITDYLGVEPRFGGWQDLERLNQDFDLMTDLVLNHCSATHPWFGQFLADAEPGRRYFITVDDPTEAWLGEVYRARNLPLLHPFETAGGTRHVWTTYSPDLIDMNWREPDVLLEFLTVILDSVARGTRMIRLDAFVYVWKERGTRCIDRPEGHELIALFGEVLDAAGAGAVAILPSITNVTQADNYRYFGTREQRKADLIYHLPLSALLLQALYTGDATTLRGWLERLPAAPPGCAYLNLAATHDGIGLTWLADLIPEEQLDALIEQATARGALLSRRRRTVDAEDRPWELNATYFSACAPGPEDPTGSHVDRLLATQSVVLALRGVPALYLSLLVAGRNDHQKVARDRDNRAINRGRFMIEDWERAAADPTSVESRVLAGLARLLRTRAACAALHPEQPQRLLGLPERSVLAIERGSLLCLTNFGGAPVTVELERGGTDLLADEPVGGRVPLAPYQARWIAR